MPWVVEDFLAQVLASLNAQGYRVEFLREARPVGSDGGAWRVAMHSPDEGMPASVIIKQAGAERPWRWNDWACQFFLSDLMGTRGLGPEFFAADEQVGYYILEDLGLGQDPGPVLMLEDGRGRLAAGLLACALAGLHAGTWGRERPFGILRAKIPGQSPERIAELKAWRLRAEDALRAQGSAPAGLKAALDSVQRELADPQEFLTLTHGDWSASSLWYGDAGPRFLDFRQGAYRHALLDLAAWELRCAAKPDIAELLWREYNDEWARLGAERGERFMSAYASARAFIALEQLAQGKRTPDVQALLKEAAQEPGLEALLKLSF